MPELPEVETVFRSIAPAILGHTIVGAEFRSRLVTHGDFALNAKNLTGTTVRTVRRQGKNIFVELDRGFLHIHLGMTGKLLWNAPLGRHTRAILEFDNGILVYDDARQFGRFNYYDALPGTAERLGPDALSIDFATFAAMLRKCRGNIKAMLLNQRYVSGIGNIYADEMLFASGIHPRAIACRLSKTRATRLYEALNTVLRTAIEHRGSSISDYVDAGGKKGGFQTLHRVYGKEGKSCSVCGSKIKRILIGQRSTHYCPRCQRT